MRAAYLASLLLSGGGLTLVDRRWRLVFWHDARRAGLVVGTGVAVLLAADLVGIALGLFFRAPELPVEEPVFLAFLCSLPMVLVRGSERVLARRGTP